MTKYEYIYYLKQELANYHGDIDDIIANYEDIIDEMLDEGLTMDDIMKRLGTPTTLAKEIVEELGLQYTQEYQESITVPAWTKTVLIICAIILFIPICSMLLGVIGTIIGFIIALLGMIIATIIGSVSIWFLSTAPLHFKLIFSLATLCGGISLSIIFYFITYWAILLVKWLLNTASSIIQKIKWGRL